MRLSSPSALRNREPIGDVLVRELGSLAHGVVLEVASGSGEHVAHFAARLPLLTFQPTEVEPKERASIAAHTEGVPNVLAPLALDVLLPWPIERADAVIAINMLHASVPETVLALMRGAGRVLPSGGLLFTYGPYTIDGAHTAPSNETFDAWLKNERDPRFGVRDLGLLIERAESAGLFLRERIAMPANNFTLIWQKR